MVLALTQCLDPNHLIAAQMFTWASLGLEEQPAGILAKLYVDIGVEVWVFKSWKRQLMLGAMVVYLSQSFGSVEELLMSCTVLCHTFLKWQSVWLEHHKHPARVLGAPVLVNAVAESTPGEPSLVFTWRAFSLLCLSHQNVPKCCHKLTVVSLKQSFPGVGESQLTWWGWRHWGRVWKAWWNC